MATGETCELLCLDLDKAESLRTRRIDSERARSLAARAQALSDPTRLAIALALDATDELCVCDLGWVTERSEKLVSHHLRLMRRAGVLDSRRDGKMVMYSLTDAGHRLLGALVVDVGVSR